MKWLYFLAFKVVFLCRKINKTCLFLSAAMNGHPECLHLLLSSNNQHINVDAQDNNKQ